MSTFVAIRQPTTMRTRARTAAVRATLCSTMSTWTRRGPLASSSSPSPRSNSYYHRSRGERSEWCFVDERSKDRFTHKGDTIVPGAGVSWKHVHRTSNGDRVRHGASNSGGGGRDWRQLAGFGASNNNQLAEAQEDDEDELPWQVIAVLDHDILRQLVGGAEYHKEKCREAMAGRVSSTHPLLRR